MAPRSTKAYDLVILGGGSAAFAAAIRSAEIGRKAAMVESRTLGGTCVNVGCVPSKQLLVTGEYLRNAQMNPFRALHCTGETLDFAKAIGQKDEVVKALRKEKYVDVLEGLDGVDLIRGYGSFVSPHAVRANGQSIRGRNFLVATGSHPWVPPVQGLEGVGYWTNVEALGPNHRPDSLLVVGGRALGLEFAQMYARFGCEVTLLQRSPRILPEEEPECSHALQRALEDDGVNIMTDAEPVRARRGGGRKIVSVKVRRSIKEIGADEILVATGRRPNTGGLNLEGIGISIGRAGEVRVNREMRTTTPNVFAAGDVRGGRMLETTAAKEGFIAAENALLGKHLRMDPEWQAPRAVFTNPQFAAVGYTEAEFQAKTGVCSCRTLPMGLVPKARIVGDTRGVVKMTIDPRNRRIMGAQIVSDLGAEMIHEATLSVRHRLTIDDIIDTVHVFPTRSEALKLVAQSFYRDMTRASCCTQ